jgi:hypothetical protein
MARANARGAEAAAAVNVLQSPETYIGYARAERFASPGGLLHDRAAAYIGAPSALNDWSLEGQWMVGQQSARSAAPGAKIHYRFHARDLHLVLGSPGGRPVRFKVTLDGQAPGADTGVDVAPDGSGRVSGERLYQLIRQKGQVRNRTFTIEFLDPGAEAFAFTFG